jgi:hypothetical protein
MKDKKNSDEKDRQIDPAFSFEDEKRTRAFQ